MEAGEAAGQTSASWEAIITTKHHRDISYSVGMMGDSFEEAEAGRWGWDLDALSRVAIIDLEYVVGLTLKQCNPFAFCIAGGFSMFSLQLYKVWALKVTSPYASRAVCNGQLAGNACINIHECRNLASMCQDEGLELPFS